MHTKQDIDVFISNMLIFVLHSVDLNLFTNAFFFGAASR